ncbi:MAG: hypothetical protein ACMUJM_14200 [bacterium]
MRNKKIISVVTIIFFILAYALVLGIQSAVAADSAIRTGNQTNTLSSGNESTIIRNADWFQQDVATTGWGGIMQQYTFGPDVGYGETGRGYNYYDPLTGASVSYSTTGIGMGTIWAPVYGGIGSPLGSASYGPFVTGQAPVVTPTYGYDTQSSIAGNAFGQGYQYSVSRPNVTSLLSMSLLQNPYTMGTGLALAYSSLGLGGYGYGSGYPFGYSSYTYPGYTGGYGIYSGYGAYPLSYSNSRPYYGYGYF